MANEKKLIDRFPTFWHMQDINPDETSTSSYGFTCGDGWFNLIWDMCLKIEEELKKEIEPEFEVLRVKEKFGSLRFYVGGDFDREPIYDLIREAMQKSETTCEMCGDPKSSIIDNGGWMVNRCERCWHILSVMEECCVHRGVNMDVFERFFHCLIRSLKKENSL